MSDYKECEMLLIKMTLSDITQADLLAVSEKLNTYRDKAEYEMDKAIIDYEILDKAADVVDMEIERREDHINGIVALCLTGK